MNNSCVIYALCDPETHAVRYIGKANDIEARLRCHRWEKANAKFHTRKVNWLRSLGERQPEVRILETVADSEWEQAERRWIAYMKASGANLTNYADGGQTSPVEGRGHCEEAKAKMRAAALRNGARPPSRKGQPVSDAAREHHRQAAFQRGCRPPMMGGWNKGMKMSSEYIESNRRGHKGIPWSPARRAAQERRS